ncbi:MAG TPA: hypothetical protein VK797_23870 [Tepidisphaeraceae bacterium]|jgi:hypothetical protein|nr:hypothetical protein [Tepidisphaeraceae bacterium]
MLLQTNSYVVPKEKRVEHARLVRRFKQALSRLGCDQFEVYEQVGTNWSSDQTSGRFVQILRFRDRRHQLAVQAAERSDSSCQAIIAEFCELINYPYQQQQGLFAIGYYSSVLGSAKALPQEPAASASAGSTTPGTEVAEVAAPPIAQEIQFGETPVQPAAEEVGGQSTVSEADPGTVSEIVSSVAEPIIPGCPAGTNGDASHEPAALAQTGGESLDELIKRRFGAVEITEPTEPTDAAAPPEGPNGEHAAVPPAGSGIGEILNAVGDDDDLDFLLPAESLDAPTGREQDSIDSHGATPDSRQH